MANIIEQFLQGEIKEVLIGVAVGTIISILAGFTIGKAITLIALSALTALILKQLLKTVIDNEKNQRTALIILALIGGFFIITQFNLGIFSLANFETPVDTSQFVLGKLSAASLTGFFGLASGGAIATLGGLIVIGFFISPIIGIGIMAFLFFIFGVPIISLSIVIATEPVLALIVIGMIALASMIFKRNRVAALTSRLSQGDKK